jgi:cysteine desulfurase/selenocysteine lyase
MNLLAQHIDTKSMSIFDVTKIRADFPILSRQVKNHPLVYLDNGASSQKPLQVINAITNYYQHTHANVHRGVHTLSQEATDAYEKARMTCKEFLNAGSTEEVIFTKGTTDSINLVAHGFGMKFLKAGDEVLISGMEHHANIVPWQLVCEMKGAQLSVIPVEEDGTIDLEKYKSLLSEKTKIVSVVHISNTLGTVNPVAEIIQLAHEKNIPVCIDGAQAAPHMKLDVQQLDVDFYAVSGHKMYGPTGIGLLYGKKKWLEKMVPYQGGGDMIDYVTFEKTTYAEIPFKYEAGTPNIAGTVGLAAAIQYIKGIGFEGIQAQEQSLLKYATERLNEISKVRIIGTAPQKASVISFVIEGAHPYDVGTILDHLGIAVRTGHHCTQPLMDRFCVPGTIRASFAFYNTAEEVDQLIAGIKKAVDMLT